MLNDARVASLGFFKDNICTTRINKEKKFKIKFQVLLSSPKFCWTNNSAEQKEQQRRILSKQWQTHIVKPVLSGHSKKKQIDIKDRLLLNAGQKYCRMLQESILQYFPPSFSYPAFVLKTFLSFLSGRLRRVYSNTLTSA